MKIEEYVPIDMLRSVATVWHHMIRAKKARSLKKRSPFKLNYGCGHLPQRGYVNVDLRWTPTIDLLADLTWCAKHLRGCCSEVYLSHVLEHYSYPGKDMREREDSVLGALLMIHDLLEPGGLVRIAVPNFAILAKLYCEDKLSLYPRLSGRLCGEQQYPQNLHRCVFDRTFLEFCLTETGFTDFDIWSPEVLGFSKDASADAIDGVVTSLNLVARKCI